MGNLLFIGHAMFANHEVKCRFYGPCAVKSVFLNGHRQSSLTEVKLVHICDKRHKNLVRHALKVWVHIAYATSKDSDKSVHPCSITKTLATRTNSLDKINSYTKQKKSNPTSCVYI